MTTLYIIISKETSQLLLQYQFKLKKTTLSAKIISSQIWPGDIKVIVK